MKFSQVFRSTPFLRVALVIAAFASEASLFAQRRPTRPPVNNLTDVINAIQFSADGRMLAIAHSARDNYRVELWDTGTGKLLRTIRGFDGSVWSVSFAPDGRTLVTGSGGVHHEKVAQKVGSRDGKPFTELKWWDPQTGDLKQRRELPSDEVVSVVALYSPDGRLLATAENRLEARGPMFDNMNPSMGGVFTQMRNFMVPQLDLKLLDAATGELRMKLKEGFSGMQFPIFMGMSRGDAPLDVYRRQRVGPIVFSPDGKIVAAWSGTEARLWSSSDGAEVLKIKKFKGRLSAIAFSPDGRLVVGAIGNSSYNQSEHELKSELRVWEVATGTPRQVIQLNTGTVTSVTFGNGRQLLISGLQRREGHFYASMELADLETGSLGKLIANDEGTISSICLSPDGATMAFQIDATTVKLVETRSWRTKFTLSSDEEASSNTASFRRFMVTVNSVSAVTFLADEKTVVGEIENGGIKAWDARTGEVRKTLALDAETGTVAAISTDGKIAEVAPDENVRLWSIDGDGYKTIPANNRSVSAVALSADGRVLAIAYENSIVLTATDNLTTLRTLDGISDGAELALSTDGKSLAVASKDGTIKIWEIENGRAKISLASRGEVTALKFETQGRLLAVGLKDGNIGFWNMDSGEFAFEPKKHSTAVNAIAFSKDGKLMATGGDDRAAVIWDLQKGKSVRALKGHDLVITSLAFSPSGEMLAVGSGNASVVMWNITNGKLDRVMK